MFRVSTALIFLLAGQGVVGASSIITLGSKRADATPSVITAGSPTPPVLEVEAPRAGGPDAQIPISPSITALGADAIPVAREEVAAIDAAEEPSWEREALPNVIRGGIEGGAFAARAMPPSGAEVTDEAEAVVDTPPPDESREPAG